MTKISRLWIGSLLILSAVWMAGCSVSVYRGLRSDRDQIANLATEVDRLRALRSKDEQELSEAKRALEERLKGEQGVQVSQEGRGIVVTIVSEILFDSGKADLRSEAKPLLSKVGGIIRETANDHDVAVEGHTDDQPIKVSKWKSNWELSSARALSVLKYIQTQGLEPGRLRATGYGEYHPVASNDSSDGRQKNRRVEIILLPRLTEKQRMILEQAERQ